MQELEAANSNAAAGVEHPQETDSEVKPRSKRARIIDDTDIDTNTMKFNRGVERS